MELALRSNHPAKMPRFFKIIVSEISPGSKLMIPEKFAKKHGEELRGRIMLKAPGGAPWPVDVERKKGEVWLRNGWPEFATFYSLCFGCVLVFEYVKHSNFRVRVFDPSATEINYPVINHYLNPDDENSVSKVKKRVADDNSSPKLKKRVVDENSAPDVKNRVAAIVKSNRYESTRAACKGTRPSSEEAFYKGPGLKQKEANGDKGSASEEEKERALNLAKAFESQDPYFILCLQPSYVRRNGVDIMKTFKDTYRKWKKRDQVIFQVGRRSWPVGCSLYGNRCTLNTGWMVFIKDNLLSVGDVCVFELINPTRKLFKVFIYRAKREAA